VIKTHEFNSKWWGKPAGIVTDPEFFGLPEPQRTQHLQAFEWVEFKMSLERAPVDFLSLHEAGFFQVDTQINYRLNMANLDMPESVEKLSVEFADEVPFEIRAQDLMPFTHERYYKLPGVTPEKVNERYALWSRQHLKDHPSTCVRVLDEGEVQGWYLSDDSGDVGLNLTLAMLSRDAKISGLLLFLKAYQGYASRGYRLGWASFSVQNTPVHNIYAGIGARFLNPTGQWMWIRDR
jgi:hypothetical protein